MKQDNPMMHHLGQTLDKVLKEQSGSVVGGKLHTQSRALGNDSCAIELSMDRSDWDDSYLSPSPTKVKPSSPAKRSPLRPVNAVGTPSRYFGLAMAQLMDVKLACVPQCSIRVPDYSKIFKWM